MSINLPMCDRHHIYKRLAINNGLHDHSVYLCAECAIERRSFDHDVSYGSIVNIVGPYATAIKMRDSLGK